MARIDRYSKDIKITDLDMFLGTDGDNYNKTVNYSARDLADYVTPIILNNSSEYISFYTDSIILTSFDEFGYDVNVKSSSDASKHFNAVYEWLVEDNTMPTKTDFSYTIEEDLSRIGEVTNCLFWVNWFCEGNTNPNKIRPALQDNVKTDINPTDWISGGYQADSIDIINIPNTYLISGSQNDDSLIRGMMEIQERGYKTGFIPVTRYIDIIAKEEFWRGTVSWNDEIAFNSWIEDYKTFYKHYIDLFYNNKIDLGIIYLGSEMPELSKTTLNSNIQRKWVDTLVELAAYSKMKFPDSIVTYAADWTEYRENLDKLWVDKNVDRIGIEFYFPILLEHSNDVDIINKSIWEGENIDYFLTGQIESERFSSTSSGDGKTNLTKNSLISKEAQLNNWREWLNNPHYFNKRAGAIADASPIITEEQINQIYDANSSGIMEGTATLNSTIDSSIFNSFETGANKRLFQRNAWLETNGSNYGKFTIPNIDTNLIDEFRLEIDFDLDINNSHVGFSRLIRFDNWLDIFLDNGTLKINYKQSNSNIFINLPKIDNNYIGGTLIITITKEDSSYAGIIAYNGKQVSEEFFTLNNSTLASIFTAPEVYLGSFSGTSDYIVAKYFKVNYHFKVGVNYYGGTYNFEDDIFGVRNEYDARFELNREIPVMATELGVASINGSLVEPNVFPFTDRSGTGYIPENNVKNYWKTVANYGLTIGDIKIPYGSNSSSDETHQKIGLSKLIPSLQKAGVRETALYNLDARYFKGLKGINQGVLWYEDAGDHIYNHALNGKKSLGYKTNIYESINPDL